MLRTYLALILTVVALAPEAMAQGFRGWYDLGGTYVSDSKLESFLAESVDDNDVEFDPGFRAGLGIGRDLSRYVTLELEGGFHYNNIKSITGATEAEASIYQVPLLANLVVRFPNRTGFVPMIGGGVGAVYSIFNADSIVVGATSYDETDETWEFAYQGFASLRYHYRSDLSVGLTYRLLVNDSPGFSSAAGLIKFDSLVNHSLSLTFGFSF